MGPAQQYLDRHWWLIWRTQIKDRLIVQGKLVSLQRLQHITFQPQTLPRPLLHRLVEPLEARLSRLLCAVKCQVGGLQGVLQSLPRQQRGNTDTGADHQATLTKTQREFYNSDRSYVNRYRIGGVKLTLDGSPQGKTAWLSSHYHTPPEGKPLDYKGYPIMSDEVAIKHINTAFKNKWQIIAHTNGDAAIDQYIKAIKVAKKSYGYDDHRSVMIHGQTLRKDQIPDLVDLGILPSLFPMHTFYWGDWHVESVLGHPRADYISPSRDVVEAGLTVTSHHDAPVTFPNSMRVLDATVNRITRSGKVLGPDQRLTPYEGLKTLTQWAAIQYFEETSKGTLAEGKLADFVILSNNPLKVDPLTIKDIKIVQSIKEGHVVYSN